MRKRSLKTDRVTLGMEDMLEGKRKGWGMFNEMRHGWSVGGWRRKAKGTNARSLDIREYTSFVHHCNLLEKLKIKKKRKE